MLNKYWLYEHKKIRLQDAKYIKLVVSVIYIKYIRYVTIIHKRRLKMKLGEWREQYKASGTENRPWRDKHACKYNDDSWSEMSYKNKWESVSSVSGKTNI